MAKESILIVSSDATFASVLERELGPDFHCHAAATDTAAFALLDAYSYGCVVLDLSARSTAGRALASSLEPRSLTVPVVALVTADTEADLPPRAISINTVDDPISRIALAVRDACDL